MGRLRLVLTLAAVAALVACSQPELDDLVRDAAVKPEALVRLSDSVAVAAKPIGDGARVLYFHEVEDGGWQAQEIGRSSAGSTSGSLALVTGGGEAVGEWNSFVFGTAREEVSRVLLTGFDGEGGQVVDGAWVIALRDQELTPNDLHWTFVDAFGAVLDSGTGIFPPDA